MAKEAEKVELSTDDSDGNIPSGAENTASSVHHSASKLKIGHHQEDFKFEGEVSAWF